MAIVGSAYVRLRVIGDKLKDDIAKSTENAVKASAPNLAASGEEVGEKISDGVGESMERSVGSKMGKVADDIGEQIGRRMAENMGKSLRRRAGDAFSNGFSGVRNRVSSIGDSVKGEWQKVSDKWASLTGKNFGKKLKGFLVAGIGFAVTALPSALAFTGAVAGALVATVIPAIASIGPAAAGAGIAFVAAFSSMKITAGLFGIAMKTESAALTDFQKRATEFKANIGRPIQVGMLSGFNAAMRIGAPLVASMQTELTNMGFAIGDVAIGFSQAVSSAANMQRISQILQTNNQFIRDAGAGASSLGQAFIIVLNALRPVTTFLGEAIRDLGAWALTALQAAEASGQLQGFVQRMFDSLRYFVGILVDFGVGIWNVFTAAHGASGGMLTTLHDIAANFREWTGSTEGQERMTRFFENMRVIAGRVLEIFGDLAGAGGRALEGTDVNSVLAGLDSLVRVGQSAGQMFEQIRAAAGPALGEAFSSFANMLVNLAESGVIGTLAGAFANLFDIISFVLNIPGVGQLVAMAAGLATLFTTVKLVMTVLRPLSIVFTVFRTVLVAVAGVIGWVPVVIGLLVAALIWFFTQTEIGRDIISAVWDFIKNAISSAVDFIVGAWNWLVEAFRTAVDWVVDLAQTIWNAISTAFTQIYNTVSTVVTATMQVFMAIWSAIWGFIQPILSGIWSFIQTVFNGIRTVIETILNVIYEIWIRIWPILALPIRILYGVIIVIWNAIYAAISFVINLIWTVVTTVWNAIVTAITVAMNFIWNIISTVWNAIWGFLQPIIQTIWGFIVGAWNAIVGAVSGAINAIWGVISSVWNAIWGFISGIVNRISGTISSIWNGIVNYISTVLNRAWAIVQDIWNSITGFISGAMDTISDLISGAWDFIGGVGEGILDGIKAAVNVVIDAINWVIDGINWAIDLANNLPGADIPLIPAIPRLAKGGVVSPEGGGTLAMIAEAGRSERVEPLDRSGLSRRDRALIETLTGGTGTASVHVYIGTRELTELVDIVVEEREDDLADRVLTGTKG